VALRIALSLTVPLQRTLTRMAPKNTSGQGATTGPHTVDPEGEPKARLHPEYRSIVGEKAKIDLGVLHEHVSGINLDGHVSTALPHCSIRMSECRNTAVLVGLRVGF
jgi:hypothetical protein